MLRQILQDMRVESDILEGLTEAEKQTLFCIMREEQVRRWKAWDQEQADLENNAKNKLLNGEEDDDTYNNVNMKKKAKNISVQFLLGEDGEPWVWVMGEHENDKTIDQILGEEAQQKARQLAEQEAKEFRKSVEAELTDIIEHNDPFIRDDKKSAKKLSDDEDNNTPIIDDLEIYCTVDELRERISNTSNKKGAPNKTNTRIVTSFNLTSGKYDKCNVLQEIPLLSNKPQGLKPQQKVSARVALWEQRLITERSNEILKGIQKKQLEKVKEAEEMARKEECLWKEQERKAKQAELKIREIARKAREEHRKSLNCDQLEESGPATISNSSSSSSISNNSPAISSSSPPVSIDSSVPRPPNQEAVLKWYKEKEMAKGAGLDGISRTKPAIWFHGLLTRAEAEKLLMPKAEGSFLVRISEKIWGYAISYKDHDRCKHYLVDASSGRYQFLGTSQLSHGSLHELVNYHTETPITSLGNEKLQKPCPVTPDRLTSVLP